jgi:dihydrofolate synthase/folylpolyglutamate synthase
MPEYPSFSLEEWLCFLETRFQQEIRLGLSRVKEFANSFGLINLGVPVITVAGTNGKGSTVSCLEAVYNTAGYRVGSYTSPHLMQFNERIRIDGKPLHDDRICEAFCFIEKNRGKLALTYFETVTLAALWLFNQSNLSVVILEVGMGGRKDATNIIDADLAIITTIDFDHQQFLGDTKEKIGFEKAGILRNEQPCIYADYSPPQSIINQAAALSSTCYVLGNDYQYDEQANSLRVFFKDKIFELPKPQVNLKAASAAIVACTLLEKKLPVDMKSLRQAMQSVFTPGRLQIVKEPHLTVFDVSHNPQSVLLLADFLKTNFPNKTIHAVFSALIDKNHTKLIEPLYRLVAFWYPAVLDGKRATDEKTLLDAFKSCNLLLLHCFSTPGEAYDAACRKAKAEDLIVVFGSFHTVGSVMHCIKAKDKESYDNLY